MRSTENCSECGSDCRRWHKGLTWSYHWLHENTKNCWLITGKQNLKLIKFALMAKSFIKVKLWAAVINHRQIGKAYMYIYDII